MACEILKNCGAAQDTWEFMRPKKLMSKEKFVDTVLWSAGERDLNELSKDLEKNMKNAGLLGKFTLKAGITLLKTVKGYVEQKNASALKKLTSNDLVSIGVDKLNSDDKKAFDFVKSMI